MPSSTRIKGAALKLTLGSPGVDVEADITSCVLDNEEGDQDVVTFADAAEGGGRQFFLLLGAVQSTMSTSFWRMVWEQSGDEVAFTYAPNGNAVASDAQPHFVGTCVIGPRSTVGGEAGATNTYTFETRFDVVGTPTMDTGV